MRACAQKVVAVKGCALMQKVCRPPAASPTPDRTHAGRKRAVLVKFAIPAKKVKSMSSVPAK